MAGLDEVVYGSYPDAEDDQVVFLLGQQIQDLRELTHALHASLTWAGFWALIPQSAREELLEALDWADLRLPNDDTRFNPSLLPGYDDGDYPSYAPATGTEWLPIKIQHRLGVGVDSMVSGSWTEYPAELAAEIVSELRLLGFSVRRDDDAIAEACGY